MAEKKLEPKEADNSKYGYVDEKGNWVIKPKFDDAWDFEEGIARVELDGKYGFIKTDGTYLVEPKFDEVEDFEDGIACVLLDEKYGFIKTDGTYLVEPKFDEVEDFEDGIAKVKLNGKYGFIKEDGTYLVEPIYDSMEGDFKDGEIFLKLNGKITILKSDGTVKKLNKTEKELNKVELYIRICYDTQFKGGSWSFLEASKESGEWQFESWSRNLGYSDSDHVYFDEIFENTNFANWANSLNLSTDKEIVELLWANAQQLINALKSYGNSSNYDESAGKLNIMIQLYWQLKNIYELGFQNTRKNLGLPEEEKIYLNPGALAEYGKKFCKENLEWGYESLWDEVIGWSHTPKHFHFRNWGDYSDAADTISGGLDDRDEDEEDEDWDEDEE